MVSTQFPSIINFLAWMLYDVHVHEKTQGYRHLLRYNDYEIGNFHLADFKTDVFTGYINNSMQFGM